VVDNWKSREMGRESGKSEHKGYGGLKQRNVELSMVTGLNKTRKTKLRGIRHFRRSDNVEKRVMSEKNKENLVKNEPRRRIVKNGHLENNIRQTRRGGTVKFLKRNAGIKVGGWTRGGGTKKSIKFPFGEEKTRRDTQRGETQT